jgi:putative PIN family toxin of toxin-antitoxin system
VRIVLDTNVLISALWKPGSVPDLAIELIFKRGVTILHDTRILAEYREVLARPKFKRVDPARTAALIDRIAASGEEVRHAPPWTGTMKDDDDRMFVEVALAGRASMLITGNLKDYPQGQGFDVLPPATVLAMLERTIDGR